MFDYLINLSKKTRHKLFRIQISFGIWILNTFGNKKYCQQLRALIYRAPSGSIGHEINSFLIANRLELVPHYEHHDFKHAILNFNSEPEDEMKMQAFMFGNSGFSVTSLAIYGLFILYTPEMWFDMPYYYRLGKLCKNIGEFTPEELCDKDMVLFRKYIGIQEAQYELESYRTYESRNLVYLIFERQVA
jgi:hypothetical protein